MSQDAPSRQDSPGRLLLDAIDPINGKFCTVEVSNRRVNAVASRSMGHARDCGILVPFTLLHPTGIFQGLTQDDDEDRRGFGWRCYCAVPKERFDEDGNSLPAKPGRVFLVFVNHRGVAYNWYWSKADGVKPELPVDYAIRFKEKVL